MSENEGTVYCSDGSTYRVALYAMIGTRYEPWPPPCSPPIVLPEVAPQPESLTSQCRRRLAELETLLANIELVKAEVEALRKYLAVATEKAGDK